MTELLVGTRKGLFLLEGEPGSPFEVIRILDVPGWHDAALWWRDERVLVCTEALGTAR